MKKTIGEKIMDAFCGLLAITALFCIIIITLIVAKHFDEVREMLGLTSREEVSVEVCVDEDLVDIEPVNPNMHYQYTNFSSYTIKYGTWEDGIIITEDGHLWGIYWDGPEFENGTEVRVMFDCRDTATEMDDIIIDVVEEVRQ